MTQDQHHRLVNERLDRAQREQWRMLRALDVGVRRAAEFHQRMGQPMWGWRDGKPFAQDPAEVIEKLDRRLAAYPQSEDEGRGD